MRAAGPALVAFACAAFVAAQSGATAPRPAGCRNVAAGSAVQPLLDAAPPGSALCLAAGAYAGPLRIPAQITLFGSREARIVSRGVGSTVDLVGAGATLIGVRIDGSGGRFEQLDAAVRMQADATRVLGVRIEHALFGILAHACRSVVIEGNEIVGDGARSLGMRGDGIRLWEVRDSRVEGNSMLHSRDLVVWYSPHNQLIGNRVEYGRYGTHLMYSHDSRIVGNRYVGNVVGIFAMYSRRLAIERNTLAASAGAAGVGIGLKEAGDVRVADNQLLDNTLGFSVDASPFEPGEHNHFLRNELRFHDRAVSFHGSPARNHFVANRFLANREQVAVDDRGDASAAEWRGNEWDDYAGYDLDGDAVGDMPYELRSLAAAWTARTPALAFFRGSPALAFVELIGRAVPLFHPTTILVDAAPRVGVAGARDAN